MKMTTEDIKEAAKAVIRLRTHRETEHNDTLIYAKRVEIDQRLDDMRTRKEIGDKDDNY